MLPASLTPPRAKRTGPPMSGMYAQGQSSPLLQALTSDSLRPAPMTPEQPVRPLAAAALGTRRRSQVGPASAY